MSTTPQFIDQVEAPTPTYVRIDPAMANQLLERNTKNRALRESRVQRYVTDMQAGNWPASTDAIAVAADGTILNGQHRLHAIVRSGVTTKHLFVAGLPAESMKVIDTGLSRTAGDYFRARKCINPNLLAAVLKLIVARDLDTLGNLTAASKIITNSVLDEALDKYEDLAVAGTNAAHKRRTSLPAPGRVLGFTHFLIAEVNGPDLADYFFDQLVEPVEEPRGSAVFAVTNRLRRIKEDSQRFEAPALAAVIIRGWNAYAVGETLERVQIVKTGKGFAMPEVRRWNRPVPLAR